MEITIDYVVELPPSTSVEGVTYRNILTVTDRLSKRKHYTPVVNLTPEVAADALLRPTNLRHVIKDQGTFDIAYSDRVS
jgi:hypothetical protein